jgi:sulfoxide reductase heme-binding subunit YedZ
VNSYTDPGQHIFWIASRAFGVTALILVAVSVGMGLAMAMRSAKGPGAMAKLKQAHEATALTALILIAAHGLALLGDTYLRPGVTGIAIPFVMAHRPAWTGLGVVGGWLAAILGLTFYARRWIGPKLWRQMHRWTLAVYVLAVIHTLGAGTDAHSFWLIVIVIATAAPLVVMAAVRLVPSDEPDKRGRPRRRIPLPSEQLSGPGSASNYDYEVAR